MMKSWKSSGGRGGFNNFRGCGGRASVQRYNCKGFGHFRRDCLSEPRSELNYVETGDGDKSFYDASVDNKDIDYSAYYPRLNLMSSLC